MTGVYLLGRESNIERNGIFKMLQSNRYAVCKACRGLSLEDSYWIRQEGDDKIWEEINLFQNPLSLFITEISLWEEYLLSSTRYYARKHPYP